MNRAFACALLLAACGPSGVQVEIHAKFELHELHLYGAVDDGHGQYVIDPRLDDQTVDVNGRNLDTTPYKVLAQNDDGARQGQLVITVIGYRNGNPVAFGQLAPPQPFKDGELVIRRIDLAEFTTAPYDTRDTGCLSVPGGISLGSADDHDCDGYKRDVDCNDEDPKVHPGAQEICGNGIDDNCNGMIDEDLDEDHDGYKTCTPPIDCNDQDPTVHPGAPEICDGKDNDCDGQCDEPFDADGDRYTTCGSKRLVDGTCDAPLPSRVDCNDNDPMIHPGAPEICDGKDNNCNGMCDEGFDTDHDLYTTCGSVIAMSGQCSMPPSAGNVDCNDMDAFIHPGQREVCDGYDDNCDGVRFMSQFEFCFTGDAAACHVGQRGCNDNTPPGFTGGCVADADAAPPEYCAAYGNCETMMARDRLACTAEGTPAKILVCDVSFSQGVLCPSAQVPLPGPTTGTCMWSFVNNTTMADGYSFSVVAPMSCMTQFSVDMFAGGTNPGPSAAFLINDQGAGVTEKVALLLQPIMVAACPTSALHCR